MKGICISFNPSTVGSIWPEASQATPPVYGVPSEDTPFCFFFRPVFPYMRDLHWLATDFYSAPFIRRTRTAGGEEELEAVGRIEAGLDHNNSVLHRPGTLPDLASSVYNDWINLVGLRLGDRRHQRRPVRFAQAWREVRRAGRSIDAQPTRSDEPASGSRCPCHSGER